jgi:SHS2 domain-containing protein
VTVREAPAGVEYLDHTADVGMRARGPSVEEVFRRAAVGLFSLMVRADAVEASRRRPVTGRAETLAGLLVEWLSALLAEKDLSGLVFGRFDVQIEEGANGFELRGAAWGEPLDPSRHEPGTEVKGISYLDLAVGRETGGDWVAECVLDV